MPRTVRAAPRRPSGVPRNLPAAFPQAPRQNPSPGLETRARPTRSLFDGEVKPGIPTGSATTGGRADCGDLDTAAGDQPSDDGVRVPHLARSRLRRAPTSRVGTSAPVAAAGCDEGPAESPRAFDRLVDVRYGAVVPAAHLVSEDPPPTGPAAGNRALRDDAPLRAAPVPHGCLLDDEAALRHAHHERGVVEIAGRLLATRAATNSKMRPFNRTEWPPAPSGSQYRSTLAGEVDRLHRTRLSSASAPARSSVDSTPTGRRSTDRPEPSGRHPPPSSSERRRQAMPLGRS